MKIGGNIKMPTVDLGGGIEKPMIRTFQDARIPIWKGRITGAHSLEKLFSEGAVKLSLSN